VVEETLARVPNREAGSVEEILEVDEQSRAVARKVVEERAVSSAWQYSAEA